jgi:hypothetical protein
VTAGSWRVRRAMQRDESAPNWHDASIMPTNHIGQEVRSRIDAFLEEISALLRQSDAMEARSPVALVVCLALAK